MSRVKNVNICAGYPTGDVVWYINDKLIPEIYVERKQTYTFFVEGGNVAQKISYNFSYQCSSRFVPVHNLMYQNTYEYH